MRLSAEKFGPRAFVFEIRSPLQAPQNIKMDTFDEIPMLVDDSGNNVEVESLELPQRRQDQQQERQHLEDVPSKKVPVTIITGYLGSGKR